MSNKSVLIKPKLPKCQICEDGVLLMEKIELNEKAYHKTCFKCCKCKKILSLGDYRKNNDDLYCVKHYSEIINPFLKVDGVSNTEKKKEKSTDEYGDEVEEKEEVEIYKETKVDLKKKEEERRNAPVMRKENKGPVIIKTSSQKCQICEETVYPLDKIECEKLVFHKACFRCSQCKKVLNLGNFKKHDNLIYCQIHYNSHVVNPNLMKTFVREGEENDVVKEEKVDLKKKEEQKQNMSRDYKAESKPVTIKTNNAKCTLCGDSVLLIEKVEVEKLTFHKTCFKCVKCKKTLNLGNFKKHDNEIYCENHYQSIVNPHLKTHENFKEHEKVEEKKREKSGYSDDEDDGYGNTNQNNEDDGYGDTNGNENNYNNEENQDYNNDNNEIKNNEEDFEVEIEVDE